MGPIWHVSSRSGEAVANCYKARIPRRRYQHRLPREDHRKEVGVCVGVVECELYCTHVLSAVGRAGAGCFGDELGHHLGYSVWRQLAT